MENPTPRAQITSMFLKGTKNDIAVDGYDINSAKFTDLARSLFDQQTHAKLADNVAEDVFFSTTCYGNWTNGLCPINIFVFVYSTV